METNKYILYIENVLKKFNLEYIREFKFHPSRKWRMDFYIPKLHLGIEFEGGIWVGGRHTRGSGFAKDCEKYNAATLIGYRLLRYTPANYTNIEQDLFTLTQLLNN